MLARIMLIFAWMRSNTSLHKFTEDNKNVARPTLGKRIEMYGITKEEIERLKNELLQERKLYETTDCIKH